MKKFFILIFILTATIGCQQNYNSEKELQKDSISVNPMVGHLSSSDKDTVLELKVQLIDRIDTLKKQLSYCGGFEVLQLLRFKVIKVNSGPYDKKEIVINIHCPLELIENKWLQNGKDYTYKLKRGSSIGYEVGQKEKIILMDYYEII